MRVAGVLKLGNNKLKSLPPAIGELDNLVRPSERVAVPY